jgi:preprotein translocase SecE subunit
MTLQFLNVAQYSTFLREVRQELKGVQWPSRAATLRFTALVVAVTLVVAVVTGILDLLLVTVVERLVLWDAS